MAALIICHSALTVAIAFPTSYVCALSPVSVTPSPNSAIGAGNRGLCLTYAETRSLPLVTPPAHPRQPVRRTWTRSPRLGWTPYVPACQHGPGGETCMQDGMTGQAEENK